MQNQNRGRLAQLVQSIWFTPRGSGVRIPHRPLLRVLSSVGSEHLVYTQRVRGSNPLEPTKLQSLILEFFYAYKIHLPKYFICISLKFLNYISYFTNFLFTFVNQSCFYEINRTNFSFRTFI